MSLAVCIAMAGPVLSGAAALMGPRQEGSAMACCRKGKTHSCCPRKAKPDGPSIAANPACGARCDFAPLPTFAAALLAPRLNAGFRAAPVPIRISGTGAALTADLPDALFERPPPSSSLAT